MAAFASDTVPKDLTDSEESYPHSPRLAQRTWLSAFCRGSGVGGKSSAQVRRAKQLQSLLEYTFMGSRRSA